MPRRNLLCLLVISVVSLICYHKVQHSRYVQTIADVMQLVERRALEPVPKKKLFEGAMQGLMGQLGDRYSTYIPPAEFKVFSEQIRQKFGGVGMEVVLDPKTKQVTVGSPIVGSPAFRAGVRAGDRILRIGDTSTQGLSLEDAVKLMRGQIGEPVRLTIQHEGEEQPVELTLVREVIDMPSVVGDRRNPDGTWNYFIDGHEGLAYLRINQFGDETVTELRRALDWLTKHDMQGLVLDLRDDPGGLLDAAVGVCDLLIGSGVIVTTRGRRAEQIDTVYSASGRGAFLNFPMAVLVNHDSASASEIVAACLQDHGRAIVVGERSYGKGTVQEVIDLSDDRGAVRLTTRSYWRPSNQNINRRREATESDTWGVMPNEGYRVPIKSEDWIKIRVARMQRDLRKPNGKNGTESPAPPADLQLNKAIEYLEQKLKEK